MAIYSGISNLNKKIHSYCDQFYDAASAKLPSKKVCLTAIALPAIAAAAYYYLTNNSTQAPTIEMPSFSNITDAFNATIANQCSVDELQSLVAPIGQTFADSVNETIVRSCSLDGQQTILPSIGSNLAEIVNASAIDAQQNGVLWDPVAKVGEVVKTPLLYLTVWVTALVVHVKMC